jgi:REP element-mobilizing transposase RayT
MSRAWRIEYEGALYHLLSRGNEQRDIFEDQKDRNLFLDTIGEFSERFEIHVFAYVMMDNHYHLLVRTRHANLKKAMHWFGTTYAQRFNRRHFRSGHLFQGRYKSILVQNDAYMLQLSYYIHRNPLRAGIVKRLADYRWSSYRSYAYGRKSPRWLSTDLIFSQFKSKDRHKRYREKVQGYAKEEKRLWEDLRHGLFLGSKGFVERIRKQHLPSETESAIPQQTQTAKPSDSLSMLRLAERVLKCDVQQFVKAGRVSGPEKDKRDLMIYLLWKTGSFRNDQIGRLFGVSYSAVSHAVRSLKTKLRDNPRLLETLNEIYSQF